MFVTPSVHSVYKVHLHVSRYVSEKSVVKALYDTEVLRITYAAAITILTARSFPLHNIVQVTSELGDN